MIVMNNSRSSFGYQTCNVPDFFFLKKNSDMIVAGPSIDGNSMYDDIIGNDLLSDYKCGKPSMLFSVADTLNRAITMPGLGKQLRHGKRYRYVSSHDVVHWTRSFMPDLKRACKDHYSKRCWSTGFSLSFRIVALSPSFKNLSLDHFVKTYKRANRRATLLDHDGTVVLQSSIVKTPGLEDLGTASEHGYFIKWNQNFNRESSPLLMDFD